MKVRREGCVTGRIEQGVTHLHLISCYMLLTHDTVNDKSCQGSETVEAVLPCSKSLCGSTLMKEKGEDILWGQPGRVNDVLRTSS